MFKDSLLSAHVRRALIAGGALCFALPAAYAQSVNQETAQDQEEASEDARPERIQVVGSRIRTDGLDNASPIDIITTELATEQGLNTLGDLLRTSTIATGSDQLTSAISVGAVTPGGSGAESISMRGLGANRTLVLLNGRRAGPAGTRGQVAAFDMNSIPISAVERVEILKDGASSLYGSDAVAGVINIITKSGDETVFNASTSVPLESGGENFRINGTTGSTFARGSYRLVADYQLQTEMARGDRDHFTCGQRYFFDAETGERADPIDPRTGDYHCNDLPYGMWVWNNNPGAGNFPGGSNIVAVYDYDGFHAGAGRDRFDPQNPGDMQLAPGWYATGYDKESDGWLDASHPFLDQESMIPENEVWSVYGQADYDLTNNISVFGELLHSNRTTTINSYRQFWEPFVYADSGLAPGWGGDVFVDPTAITDHSGSVTEIEYSRGVIGLEGAVGYWNWEMSFQRSYNSGTYDTKIILDDALVMATDAIFGDPCVGELSPVSGRPCVEIDFFDPEYVRGNFTQDTRDFLFGTDYGKTAYKQDSFDAYITGDMFELPAGHVAAAYGVAYQADEIQDTPGEQTRLNNAWGSSSAGITAGSSYTRAVYGEVQIPVVRDLPFVEAFDITASGRWTDVNVYGSDTTYKLAFNWDIAGGFRLRGSRGTSFRAPSLYELYLADQTGFPAQQSIDPCFNWGSRDEEGTINPTIAANCAADGIPVDYPAGGTESATEFISGNSDTLTAETSTSDGIGIVYTSPDNRFGASVDYYDVTIDGQIAQIGAAEVLNLCYTSDDFPNDPFCELFTRHDGSTSAPEFSVNEVFTGYQNIASQTIRGVDTVLTYRDQLPFGELRLRLSHTTQIERTVQQLPTSPAEEYVGLLGNPKHSGTLNTTLVRDDWSFNWAMNYFSKVDNYSEYEAGNRTSYRGTPVTFVADAPTTFYHSFSATRNFEQFDFTLGVANAFDKTPPRGSRNNSGRIVGNSRLYSQYDNLGRRIFANVTYTF